MTINTRSLLADELLIGPKWRWIGLRASTSINVITGLANDVIEYDLQGNTSALFQAVRVLSCYKSNTMN